MEGSGSPERMAYDRLLNSALGHQHQLAGRDPFPLAQPFTSTQTSLEPPGTCDFDLPLFQQSFPLGPPSDLASLSYSPYLLPSTAPPTLQTTGSRLSNLPTLSFPDFAEDCPLPTAEGLNLDLGRSHTLFPDVVLPRDPLETADPTFRSLAFDIPYPSGTLFTPELVALSRHPIASPSRGAVPSTDPTLSTETRATSALVSPNSSHAPGLSPTEERADPLEPPPTSSAEFSRPTMSSRKRNSTAAGLAGVALPSSSPGPTSKRKRSAPSTGSAKRQRSGDAPRDDDVLTWSDSDHDSDIIDLRDPTKVPEILLQRQQKRADRVKLGAFQCAICMDHSTSLTVTHCGHLFCGDCLVSALNIENQKNKCPICRQKIENRSRDSYKQTTKGIWPLELKLMTTTRKGKRSHA